MPTTTTGSSTLRATAPYSGTLISDDPMNLDLQKQQAFFYLRAGMPEKARATFKNLVAADPKDTRSQFYLAESLSDLAQYEEAEKIYHATKELIHPQSTPPGD